MHARQTDAPPVFPPRTADFVTPTLSIAALALGLCAVAKVLLYLDFKTDIVLAGNAGFFGESRDPDILVPASEQPEMAPLYLAYYVTVIGYVLFGGFFVAAAVTLGRGTAGARRFTVVGSALAALLCAIPGLFDVGWRVAIAKAEPNAGWEMQQVKMSVPDFYADAETIAHIVVVAAAVLAAVLLYRPGAVIRRSA